MIFFIKDRRRSSRTRKTFFELWVSYHTLDGRRSFLVASCDKWSEGVVLSRGGNFFSHDENVEALILWLSKASRHRLRQTFLQALIEEM